MILVLNCGSSSIKYQLFGTGNQHPSADRPIISSDAGSRRPALPDAGDRHGTASDATDRRPIELPDAGDRHRAGDRPSISSGAGGRRPSLLPDGGLRRLSGGLIERIGEPGGPASHAAALADAAADLYLDSPELTAIGHRVVHGGSRFVEPTLITDAVIAAVEELTPLAPLHNPPALAGIAVTRGRRPALPQVAVFDTAFHATLPAAAHTYAIDADVAAKLGIRRYGFHGTSYAYVSRQAAVSLGRALADVNMIVLHLGNGASACAVAGGRSVETSMGLTPLEGLVMGNRSGDLDPGVLFHLHRIGGYSLDAIDDLLNRHSGMRGLTGDNDMRTVITRRDAGDPAATLAIDAYCHRLRKYIGAYAAVLGRVDALVFTGGVGENAAAIRSQVLTGLDGLGFAVDPARNAAPTPYISPDGAPTAVLVIPTDEEREIATQTAALTGADQR